VTERSLKTFQGKQQEHFKWASLWLAGQNLYNLTNSTSHVTRSSAAVSYRVGKVLRVCIHRPVVVVPQLITLQSELGGGIRHLRFLCCAPRLLSPLWCLLRPWWLPPLVFFGDLWLLAGLRWWPDDALPPLPRCLPPFLSSSSLSASASAVNTTELYKSGKLSLLSLQAGASILFYVVGAACTQGKIASGKVLLSVHHHKYCF